MIKREVILKVAEAFQQDVGYGRARIDHQSRMELDLSIGDVIEIEGTKNTAVVVWRADPSDEGKKIIRIDNLTRKNAGTGLGDSVKISQAEVRGAKSITIAPSIPEGQRIQLGTDIGLFMKKELLKRPVTTGDIITIPRIAFFGSALPFTVIKASPDGVVT